MKNKVNFNSIFDELFPICRSITGEGYNRSLGILSRYISFKKMKYPSGKKIFDWLVPKVWKVKDAYIEHKKKRIVDFKKNNLHVMGYSRPINKRVSLEKLNRNLFSIKKYPNLIPYVTSYYEKNWGFCIQHKQRKSLKKGDYKVVVNSSFHNGYVINGLAKLKGRTRKIILLSSYLCHPSMANNELSGPLVMLGLFEKIKKWVLHSKDKSFLKSYIMMCKVAIFTFPEGQIEKNYKLFLRLIIPFFFHKFICHKIFFISRHH